MKQTAKSSNPLKGKTLGIFSPESRVRNWLCDLLVYPLDGAFHFASYCSPNQFFLPLMQLKMFTYPGNGRPKNWGGSWIDFAITSSIYSIHPGDWQLESLFQVSYSIAPEYGSGNGKRGLRAVSS